MFEPQLEASNNPPTAIPLNTILSDEPPTTFNSAILKSFVICMLSAVPGKVLYIVIVGAVTVSNTELAPIEPTVWAPQ